MYMYERNIGYIHNLPTISIIIAAYFRINMITINRLVLYVINKTVYFRKIIKILSLDIEVRNIKARS